MNAEHVSAEVGLGSMIHRAGQQFAVDQIYAGIVLTGLLGHLINLTFRTIEPHLMPWRTRAAGSDGTDAGAVVAGA